MKPTDNQAAGGHLGAPDPCPTQVGPATVTMPYVNTSQNAASAPSSPNIIATGAPVLNMGSQRPMTMGDNSALPGTSMKPEECVAGSPNVTFNGLPATTAGTPTTGNGGNCAGAKVMPSATNVMVNDAGAAADPHAELARIARSLPRDGSAVSSRLLPGGVGCIRIAFLSRDVPARVHTAVERLLAQGMRSLELDLRGNPGGELDAFLELAGDFLPPGSELVTMRDADGDDTVYRAAKDDPYRFPVVVRVDRGTASAAELLAGCLKAHGRAVLAGERTYGKGTGHAVVPRPGELALERAVFLLPGGAPVDGAGVTPDVASAPAEDVVAERA